MDLWFFVALVALIGLIAWGTKNLVLTVVGGLVVAGLLYFVLWTPITTFTSSLVSQAQVAGPAATPAPVAPPSGGVATKCEWLRANFPQSTEGVQALGARMAGVQAQRVRTHLYPCSSSETIFDGFIVLGPNEGYPGVVTMTVPYPGAVIDAWKGAQTEFDRIKKGEDTYRSTRGWVRAESMTFWPWHDEDPPKGSASFPTGSVTSAPVVLAASAAGVECVDPTKLAAQQGWQVLDWADKRFGGLRVTVPASTIVPPMWEAIQGTRKVLETDTDRGLSAGVVTVYPPYSCREQLGYSK